MYRPLIGVPAQSLHATLESLPRHTPDSSVMNHLYCDAVIQAGGTPVLIPLSQDEATLRDLYERLDGILLAGGADIDPASYGADRHPACGPTDPARDQIEIRLTRWALDDGKPLLGICRGMQMLNVACGGTLHQDCTLASPHTRKHDFFPSQGFTRGHLAHTVWLEPGSWVSAAAAADTIEINSLHHQAVDQIGENLRPTAIALDNTIEALEVTSDRFQVGIQWHPEALTATDEGARALFTTFVEESARWRQETATHAA